MPPRGQCEKCGRETARTYAKVCKPCHNARFQEQFRARYLLVEALVQLGLTYVDIAETLGWSEARVRNLRQRGRKRLEVPLKRRKPSPKGGPAPAKHGEV